jgi:hypothetical protein
MHVSFHWLFKVGCLFNLQTLGKVDIKLLKIGFRPIYYIFEILSSNSFITTWLSLKLILEVSNSLDSWKRQRQEEGGPVEVIQP